MRIEELQNNMYIKSTDSVEKFLLNIIQEYFKDSNEALEGSKEYIIREAVDRLKTEMDYNSLGVLSITLPNGEVKTGDVTITLEDLGGEPLISPKLSAFNVDFGTEAGTACEGNDPRLSDARRALPHQHEISDIIGLEGILSTIQGRLEREGVYNHEHLNKDVLDMITYTGSSDKIDLSVIDTLEPKIDQLTETIRQDVTQYISDTETDIEQINIDIATINQRIDGIYQYVLDKCQEYLTETKQYTDDKVQESMEYLTNYIETNFVKKDTLADLIDIAQSCYTFIHTEKWNIQDLFLQSDEDTRIADLPLSQYTLDELQHRSIQLANTKQIIFNFALEYQKDGITIRQPIPYLDNFDTDFKPFMYPLIPNLTLAGYIQTIRTSNNALKIAFKTNENQLPDYMLNGSLVCDVYSKAFCPVYY